MTHRDFIELLPWYVNATLKDQQRRAVEAHLAGCRTCVQELEELKAIRAKVVELGEEAPEPSGDLLGRTLSRIEATEKQDGRATERRLTGLSARLERIGGAWEGWWRPLPGFARVAVTAQFVLLVGFGAVIYSLWERDEGYTTLSGPAVTGVQGPGVRVLVGFQEGVSEPIMRQTILDVRGTIVAGPSSLGLYTVELPVAPGREEAIEKALGTLRENREVVEFVERTR